MSRVRMITWTAILLIGATAISASYRSRAAAERRLVQEVALAAAEPQFVQQQVVHFTKRVVPAREAFGPMLVSMGLDSATAAAVVSSAQRVFNFRLFQAGKELTLGRSLGGEFRELRYQIDPERFLRIVRSNGQYVSQIETIPTTTEVTGVSGKVEGSLFDAVEKAGERPELALRLADIFSWDMDFYTDPRPGDTFRLVVEETKTGDGQTIEYGKILAAEYNNDGRIYRAVLFHDSSGAPAYYTSDGKSLKKAFLHSPLKFAAVITSHFSYHRFHPILKIYRPHLGTDYAAPIGTPVQSIGDGRVIFAGRRGEDGNLVKIEHINGYETYYMHLSRILVHPGQRVVQGQRIGLVGMSGLATGPHLDFRIERHGQFMNFEKLPLPPASPVARRDRSEFEAVSDRELNLLPHPGPVVASTARPAGAPNQR